MSSKSFRKSVLVYRKKALFIALRMLNNEQDAEDVVQEVVLKLWIAKENLRKIENTEAYLVTMVKNRCLDLIRLKKQHTNITESSLISEETIEDNFQSTETTNIIARLIERLPELQKLIIRMHDIDGYTTKEIAQNTGTTPESIRMNLSRARKKIKDMYQKILENEV